MRGLILFDKVRVIKTGEIGFIVDICADKKTGSLLYTVEKEDDFKTGNDDDILWEIEATEIELVKERYKK